MSDHLKRMLVTDRRKARVYQEVIACVAEEAWNRARPANRWEALCAT